MTPLEYLEEGIRQGNWETVCEGYERLTGKAIPCPPGSATAELALGQIADIVSAAIINQGEIFIDPSRITKKKAGRPKKKSKKKTDNDEEDASLLLDIDRKTITQRETGGTQLITNDPDPDEIEYNKVQSLKSKTGKVKLKRQTTRTFDVKCNECEKTFQSSRKSGEFGQKCPKCLKDKKR